MKQMNSLHQTYLKIRSLPSSTSKKLMLQSLKQQLLQMQKGIKEENVTNNEKQQITITKCTENSSKSITSNYFFSQFSEESRILPNSLTGNDYRMEFQDRIVDKQKIKFKMNQDIELLEEEYLSLQGHIVGKQQKISQLEKNIAKISYQISKGSRQLRQDSSLQESANYAQKFICFFF